jgi:hypothetical protein
MNRTHVFALALFLGASGWAIAQGPPQGQPGGQSGRPPMPPTVAALDANHDGTIDETEIANAPAALRTLDKNSDGKLTMDEFRPARPGGQGGPGPAGQGMPGAGGPGGAHPRMPIMLALDANKDGLVDEKEIANAPAALRTLDKNKDGKLSRDEFMPPRPGGQAGPGGPPQG